MGSYHAKLSPSSAHRWSSCTASPSASEGLPNEGSEVARYGTCGHQIHAECLEFGYEPQEYLGRVMNFYAAGGEDWSDVATPGMVVQHTVTVDQALIDAVATCLKYVTEVHALVGGEMHVEQRVPIGQFTGEYDEDGTPAGGTSDVTIISKPVMRVCDVKLGRKKVDDGALLLIAKNDRKTFIVDANRFAYAKRHWPHPLPPRDAAPYRNNQ